MPLYEYFCGYCDRRFDDILPIEERHNAKCECGSAAILQLPSRAPGISTFAEGWYRDIDYHPIYISNPQQLRDECDKRGKICSGLENSIHKTSPGPDFPEGNSTEGSG